MLSFAACSGGKSGSSVDQAFLGGVTLDFGRTSIAVGTSAITSGTSTIFTLTTRDQNSATYVSPTPLTVVFNISGGTSTGVISGTMDSGNGTYTALFTGGSAGTPTNVSATINGVSVTHTPPTVQVTGGVTPVAGNSSIVGSSPVTADGVAASTVTITLKDASNIAVAGVVPTFTATDTGATNVYGVCPATDVAGISICTLKSTKAETKTLSLATPIAFAGGTVTFQPGAASQIVYTTQPSASTVAGVAFATQPILAIEDANGNVVTSGADATATVSLAITTGSGALGGTVSMSAVAGVANFVGKGLNIDLTGTNKVLTATKADTTGGGGTTAKTATTSAFTITNSAATQIVYTTQPSASTVAGVAFATQPVLTIKDTYGNVVTTGVDATATVSLAITTGSGTLGGTVSMSAVAGVADFVGTGLNIDLVGVNKVLTATKADTTGGGGTTAKTATTGAFTITNAPASQILFSTQPAGAVTGVAFTTQPVVTIKDTYGNVVTTGADSTVTISLSLTTGPGTLGGTTSMSAVAGVADFVGKGLNINLQGAADVLTASTTVAAGAKTATSSAFAVALGSVFTQHYPYTFGTDASYTFNTSLIDLWGGNAELTNQFSDYSSGTFGAGASTGTAWDASNTYLRLDQSGTPTNNSDFDQSWTPQWGSLVGLWHMNGTVGAIANNATITATIGTNGTAKNANGTGMAYAAGKLSQGITFDATDDYIDFGGDVAAYDMGTSSQTVSFWAKFSGVGYYPITKSRAAGEGGRWFIVYGDPGCGAGAGNVGYYAFVESGGNYCGDSSKAKGYNDGQWHHVVGVWDRTANMSLYVDGVLKSSLSISAFNGVNLNSTSSLFFNQYTAAAGNGPYGAGAQFAGSMDEVAIWHTALTAAEIKTIYTRQSAKYSGTFLSRTMDALSSQAWTNFSWSTTLPFFKALPDASGVTPQSESTASYTSLASSTLMTGLAGLWHFDEAAGTSGAGSVKDTSGKGNNGTPTNVTFGGLGTFGTSATFDGTLPSNIAIADNAALSPGTGDLTVALWFKAFGTYANDGWMYADYGNNTNNVLTMSVQFSSSNKLLSTIRDTAGNVISVSSLTTVNDGKWHLGVMVKSGTTINLYLDNQTVQTASNAALGAVVTDDGNPPMFGRWPLGSSLPFTGSLDEAAIWSRALSGAEVQQLYRRGTNRLRYQARTCTAANCTDDPTGANWKGPDGTNQTYFSELYNMSTQSATPSGTVLATVPNMLFSNFTSPPASNRYFQYRAILESDDTGTSCDYGSGPTWCSPELKKASPITANSYDTTAPTITYSTGVGYHYLTSFTEVLGANGCAGGAKYILSLDNTNWYWYTGGVWVASDGTYAKANSAASLTGAAMNAFAGTVGTGNIYFKAFLKSNGVQACEIDDITIGGNQ